VQGFGSGERFRFRSARDTFVQGGCDESVRELSRLLGWEAEFDALVDEVVRPSAKKQAAGTRTLAAKQGGPAAVAEGPAAAAVARTTVEVDADGVRRLQQQAQAAPPVSPDKQQQGTQLSAL